MNSLYKHIKESRPRLSQFIEQLKPIGSKLWETGSLSNDFDVNTFNAQAQEALEADQSKACLDSCIWASMEWKWQT
jgi:hypothetical protein